MHVNRLLYKAGYSKVRNNHIVAGITSNSKKVKEGFIFVVIKGSENDGYDYIVEAINSGAKTIISYKEYNEFDNVLVIDNVKDALALLLSIYYSDYSKKLKYIGVTGTNGKTSTSLLIYKYLEYNNIRSMVIGSNGVISLSKNEKTNNTTPNIEIIYDNIVYASKLGYKYIILEVSSAAISEYRVKYINFNIMVFTNFSLDHLDYHKTIESYFNAKKSIFDDLSNKSYALINSDDEKSKEVVKNTKAKVKTFGVNSGDYKGNIIATDEYLTFSINDLKYYAKLLGAFNVYNILPLFIIQDILHLNDNLKQFLMNLKPIPGRMNKLIHNDKMFIIDYAHTPLSVEESIKACLALTSNKLYVVVGCGGDRDKSKRKIIGEILSKYEITRIITSDNPRFEDPDNILDDISSGMTQEHFAFCDRKDAIRYAYKYATKDDIILVLGKGIEPYLDILGNKIPYSDFDFINSLK